jgi:hypothetical protein
MSKIHVAALGWEQRMSGNLRKIVGRGRVSRRLYTDPDIFEEEMKRIFSRVWLWLGHESQLQNPGDFFTTRMGRDRIIVARHKDGEVYAFHNRCTHRGAEVCPQKNRVMRHISNAPITLGHTGPTAR